MTALHKQDFCAWTQLQAQFLKKGQLSQLDIPHLIEELESMSATEKRELISRLVILLMHLLKWQFQPAFQSRSWLLTIEEQRLQLDDHLDENPSLKNPQFLQTSIDKAYRRALVKAEKETGLSRKAFPQTCPYSFVQMMDMDFYPTEKDLH
ncbi:MAG: DUF29 family protein [Methylococcaceae bacterium]|nr:DUF29 family protein [Methylococcaceae bacterium]